MDAALEKNADAIAGQVEVVCQVEVPEALEGTATKSVELDPRVRRKVDLRILPLVALLYLCSFL